MKGYQIPNTDNTSHLTRNLTYNYQKYRTLLHFIYINKDFYHVNHEGVSATEESLILESGKVVNDVANLQFNIQNWKILWDAISSDNVFIYHVKKVLVADDSEDVIELLNGIVPCGITQYMGDAMSFAESLKQCYEELTYKISSEESLQKFNKDYEILNCWLENFKEDGPEKFTIPTAIFGLAQAFTEEGSPDYANNLTDIISDHNVNNLLRPYVWATVIEVFYNAEIELPIYIPHSALSDVVIDQKIPEICPQKQNAQIDQYLIATGIAEKLTDLDGNMKMEKMKNGTIDSEKVTDKVEKIENSTRVSKTISENHPTNEIQNGTAGCDEVIKDDDGIEKLTKTSQFPLENHASGDNVNGEKLSIVVENEGIDKDTGNNQNEKFETQKRKIEEADKFTGSPITKLPQVTLSIPLLPGMIVKGLQFEFKCTVKSFRTEQIPEHGAQKYDINTCNSLPTHTTSEISNIQQNNNDEFKDRSAEGSDINSKKLSLRQSPVVKSKQKRSGSSKIGDNPNETLQEKIVRYV